MDYREYEVEDFLLDPSFRDYCLGKNEKAILFWEQWMATFPEKLHVIRQARQLYALLNGNHAAQGFLEDEKAFRLRFAGHLGEEPEPSILLPARSRGKWLFRGAVAAASMTLLLLVILFARRRPHAPNPDTNPARAPEYVQNSKAGERKSFQLPDGSKVMLNAGSTLRILAGFNSSGREISLEGEAFFDVARDARRPFVIHTSRMDIKVLGTAFNVKAYPGDALTETSLLTGSVEVLVKDGQNKKFILQPSEKIIVPNGIKAAFQSVPAKTKAAETDQKSYKIEKLSFNKKDSSLVEISWTESRLAFNDNSFEEIANQLERWYNVSIRFDDESVKRFRFTATFDKKTIGQVLSALQLSRPFDYRMEESERIVIGDRRKEQ